MLDNFFSFWSLDLEWISFQERSVYIGGFSNFKILNFEIFGFRVSNVLDTKVCKYFSKTPPDHSTLRKHIKQHFSNSIVQLEDFQVLSLKFFKFLARSFQNLSLKCFKFSAGVFPKTQLENFWVLSCFSVTRLLHRIEFISNHNQHQPIQELQQNGLKIVGQKKLVEAWKSFKVTIFLKL